ncbi:MAG: response regulator [Candidatus Omnitrophica bacterium]|nr:response regulator [Candidatus Omnitrophota bacterium]MDD5653815.1 response regulator [Candidatus Omnitrophota bacterium]
MAKKNILIADDDKDILQVLEKKFRENDYDVFALAKGMDVIEKFKTFNYKPDLLIMDIVMQDTDGFAVAAALRDENRLKDLPIIFMTAKDLDYSGIKKRLLDLGECTCISKPCTFDELLTKVKNIIG